MVRRPLRLLRFALAAWLARWAALELASWLGRRRPRGAPPVDSPRIPGRMPRRRER
ncbi:MAG: hypothetical protein IRZ20_05155 [Thermoleophilia bacterium]|nr:hypothetical protein [Thermoleophilia bacterium]